MSHDNAAKPAAFYDPDTGTLHVGALRTTDPAVLREAVRWSDGERGDPVEPDELAGVDLTPFAREALSVGARVLGIAAQANDTHAVQQAVQAATQRVDEVVARASASTAETTRRAQETMAASAHQASSDVLAHITRLVGGENPELAERLRPVLATLGSDLEHRVGDVLTRAQENAQAAAQAQHTELVTLVHQVRQEVAVKVAEQAAAEQVRDRSTLKGLPFEDQVHAAMGEIAAGAGDSYVPTGDRAGILPRNKKGDGVLTAGDGTCKIVVEMHDGSTKDWGSYLQEAERNREAASSIGVVRHTADNGNRVLRVIGGRRVVVAFNPDENPDAFETLQTAVLLVRTATLATSGSFGEAQVSTAAERIDEALAYLESLGAAEKSANAILGHVDSIKKSVATTLAAVRRELGLANAALTGSSPLTLVENEQSHTVPHSSRS